jgi:isopentenyl phosphate kinase
VDDVIGIISSLTSIIQGVQTIISIFSNTAMAANTAAIIANTAALTANSVANLIPLAHGGIVPHAANGYYVPGTHASGDVTPIMANAGELVLNKSSQNNLANELKGAEALVQTIDRYQTSIMRGSQYNYGTPTIGGGMLGNMKLETLITGEQIRLVLNNNGRRTGRGEYITTNFK